MEELRFRWNGTNLVDITGAPTIPLYVADSFLVVNGTMVAKNEHRERFSRSATHQGLINPVHEFLDAAYARIPREGSIFPRIDLTERGELELRLRQAPELTSTLVVASADHDPRREPTIKGPDIPELGMQREFVKSLGADEAIIVNEKNQVLDGATTCVIWVRDETVYQLPRTQPRVESVTVSQLQKILAEPLPEKEVTVEDIEGTELYLLNSLHGIRAVTQWINGPEIRVNHDRLDSWRQSYDALFEAI